MTASGMDTYIPYGRGGAGNMRRRSKLDDPWFKSAGGLVAKSVRSSSPSISGEHKSVWRKLWMKKRNVAEDEDDEDMILEDCEKCGEERTEDVV